MTILSVLAGWPDFLLDKYVEAQEFHDDTFEACVDDCTDNNTQLYQLLARMDHTTVSTAFSGIDAPGTAWDQIRSALDHKLGRDHDVTSISRHLHAIEWENHSQVELLAHPSAPRCLFGNIEDFLVQGLRSQLDTLQQQDKLQSVLLRVVAENTRNAIKT